MYFLISIYIHEEPFLLFEKIKNGNQKEWMSVKSSQDLINISRNV